MANSDYGAIPLTLAESTSEALNTKLGVTTGFKPSEWPSAIASIPTGGGSEEAMQVTISVNKPTNSETIGFAITDESNQTLYNETISCDVYGAFNKKTINFMAGDRPVSMQIGGTRVQGSDTTPFFVVEYNGWEMGFVADGTNSSYSCIKSQQAYIYGSEVLAEKIIDWALYSHPNAFDSIPMPDNYTDYSTLYFVIINENEYTTYKKYFENMALAYVNGDVDNIAHPSVMLKLNVSDILDTDTEIHIPICANDAWYWYSTGHSRINSSRILGYNYPLNWQNLYLGCFGVK